MTTRLHVCRCLRELLRNEPRGTLAFCDAHRTWGRIESDGFITVTRATSEPFPRTPLDVAELDELRRLLR